jgi:hypothetical protein
LQGGRDHSEERFGSRNLYPMTDNGWNEYQKLVLHRLEEADRRLHNIEGRLHVLSGTVDRHSERLVMIGASFGFIAGLIPSVITLVFN